MSEENKVECVKHGKGQAAFLCRHLSSDSEKLGFNFGIDPEDPDALYPDAWCDNCEEAWQKEGEWNDISMAFADIKLICGVCYREARSKNWIQDEMEYRKFIQAANEYVNEKQARFLEEFKINDHDRWDWNSETGKLSFSQDGKTQVEADFQFSGSFGTASETWMWAWANESFEEGVKSLSRHARDLGEENGFMQLCGALWKADAIDGWEMTSVLASLIQAIGVYRAPSDNGFAYMVVTKAEWVNDSHRKSIVESS